MERNGVRNRGKPGLEPECLPELETFTERTPRGCEPCCGYPLPLSNERQGAGETEKHPDDEQTGRFMHRSVPAHTKDLATRITGGI